MVATDDTLDIFKKRWSNIPSIDNQAAIVVAHPTELADPVPFYEEKITDHIRKVLKENFGPHNPTSNLDPDYLKLLVDREGPHFKWQEEGPDLTDNDSDFHAETMRDPNYFGYHIVSADPNDSDIGGKSHHKIITTHPAKEVGFLDDEYSDPDDIKAVKLAHETKIQQIHDSLNKYSLNHEIATWKGYPAVYVPVDQSHLFKKPVTEALLSEDGEGAGPTNTAGGGAVAGIGVTNKTIPNQAEPGVTAKNKVKVILDNILRRKAQNNA